MSYKLFINRRESLHGFPRTRAGRPQVEQRRSSCRGVWEPAKKPSYNTS